MLQQKRDVQSCYFAAQTMRTKIQLSFHELPPEAHASLRDSLMENILKINEHTNNAIVTQVSILYSLIFLEMNLLKILFCLAFINRFIFSHLQLCLALADLALQMSSWQKPVVDLINRFGGSTVYLWPLLEILTVLPEEVNSRSLRYCLLFPF